MTLLIQIGATPVYAYSFDANLYVGTFQGVFSIPERGEYEVTIYYPVNGSGKPYPAVIFAHGFCSCCSWHKWIGNCLAIKGYVALLFTVPDRVSTDVQQWVDGIEGGIRYLQQLNNESEEFHDMIDMSRLGVMGHSMGAMAALIAASRDLNIKAIVSLAAPYLRDKHFNDEYADELLSEIDWEGVLSASRNITIPVQFQVGTRDALASDSAIIYYEASNSVSKEFVSIEGGNHVQYLDEEYVWSMSSLYGALSLFFSLGLRIIIEMVMLYLSENGLKIIFMDKLVGAAVAFGIDQPATITPSRQHEISSQNFLTFFNIYL